MMAEGEGKVVSGLETSVKKNTSRKTSLGENIMWKYSHRIETDFYVKIAECTVPCHIMVLKCFSAFFRPYRNGETASIPKDIPPAVFKAAYDWMLGKDSITKENVLELFIAAKTMEVPDLGTDCWNFINTFNEGQALVLYIHASNRGLQQVMSAMLPRICRVFLPLTKSELFRELSLDVVCNLLRSDFICVHSEVEVFVAACSWLKFDWEERNIHFSEVMKCVRFGLMRPWQLHAIRRNSATNKFQVSPGGKEVHDMIEDGLALASSTRECAPPQRNWIDYREQCEDSGAGGDRCSADDEKTQIQLGDGVKIADGGEIHQSCSSLRDKCIGRKLILSSM